MQGRSKVVLPGSSSSVSNCCWATALSQRKLPAQLPSVATRSSRGRLSPGKLPRLSAIQTGLASFSGQIPVPSLRQDADKRADPSVNGQELGQRARPGRSLYKVSEDPLLRQTQMLLEASRRLREQSMPLNGSVDRQGYYGYSSSPTVAAQDAIRLRSSLADANGKLHFRSSVAAALAVAQQRVASAAPQPATASAPKGASFGTLAAASATAAAHLTAAHLTAAHISAVNAAAASAAAAATGPSESRPSADPSPDDAGSHAATATGRDAVAAAAAASSAVAAAALPPAASASAAASGLSSAAASSWYYIEELLEEAAYSLSQELPGGQASSPLDALMATATAASTSSSGVVASSVSGPVASAGLQGLGLVPGSVALPGLDAGLYLVSELGAGAASAASGLAAAVPVGDMLSEALEDLLYSLSQDINLATTQEAMLAAATAAAAGLAGAAAELPRAAASVYRSAAEAASAAAAARAASSRDFRGGGSGGTAFVVPDEAEQAQLEAGEEYDMEPDAAGLAYDNATADPSSAVNPPWDSYGTIRAAEQAAVAAAADTSAAAVSAVGGGASSAAADGAVAALPIVTASAAPSVAEAATATAAAVVEAATTAAAGTIVLGSRTAPPPPSAAPSPPPAAAAVGAGGDLATIDGTGGLYGGLVPESSQPPQEELDQLAAALQSLLAAPDGAAASAAAVSGLDAGAQAEGAAVAAAAAAEAAEAGRLGSAADAEAALSSLTEALRRELGAVVGSGADAVDADPTAIAQAAGQAVNSALASLSAAPSPSLEQLDLTALPQDARLGSLLGATLQSSLDLVEAALGGVRSADSTLVGGVTIAAVMAVLIRSLVSLAGAAVSRSREGAVAGGGEGAGATAGGGGGSRLRPVGVTALEAAAALNNDPQALLLDIRNSTDVSEQGLPDLRPFRRGTGAATVSLPYCDFRTTPTLANPSGALSLLGGGAPAAPAGSSSSLLLSPRSPPPAVVSVAVDPQFVSKFRGLAGLDRDSRVFLIDSYGVEAAEAVLLLRADPHVERLLGAQGVKYVEGGFAGPEGWKLTGLPVMDAPLPEGAEAAPGSRPVGLDLSGLLGSVAGLRVRYPSLFTRTLALGAAGGAGVAVASTLDWGAISRGAVGLAAAMLLTDRVLPQGVRPSGKIREYLQAQLSATLPGAELGSSAEGAPTAAVLAARRRRTALLLRALDLAEAVGDAIVRAGGAAVAAAGSAAKGAISSRTGGADVDGAIPAAPAVVTGPAAADTDIAAAALETPPPAPAASGAATIVLPHGMDSPQWTEAAELAVVQGQQQQTPQTPAAAAAAMAAGRGQTQTPHTRSASPLRPNCRLGPAEPEDSSSSSSSSNQRGLGLGAAAARTAAAASEPPPPRSSSPSLALAGRLGDALRSAADAVVRAASPARPPPAGSAAASARSPSPRSPSPGSQPDTLQLMTALATASALSHVDSGLLPGWPAVSFPKASAGQAPPPVAEGDAAEGRGSVSSSSSSSRGDASGRPLYSSFVASSSVPASEQGSGPQPKAEGRSPWSSWRQELEAVAPSAPSSASASVEAGAPLAVPLAAGGGASAASAALRQGRDKAALPQPPQPSSSSSPSPQRSKRPLRTSSPERAAAAGAAMRLLRVQMGGLDDDGLGSGAYGSAGFFGGGSDDENALTPATASSDGKRSGGVAAAGMASGTGGLPPGLQTPRQQATDRAVSAGGGGGDGAGRQRRPLRTASPERAAAAAATLRQLRAEVGLLTNDGRSGAGAPTASALVPRDWRRELDAAAAVPEPEEAVTSSSSEEEERVPKAADPRITRFRQAAAAAGAAATAAAAASVAVSVSPSRSPRNWRDQLEGRSPQQQQLAKARSGNGGAPADWRSRVEGGADDSGSGSGSPLAAVRSSSPPGRAKLTPAERAERDARLQDWRARV